MFRLSPIDVPHQQTAAVIVSTKAIACSMPAVALCCANHVGHGYISKKLLGITSWLSTWHLCCIHPPIPTPYSPIRVFIATEMAVSLGGLSQTARHSQGPAPFDQVSCRSQHSGHPHRIRLPAPHSWPKKTQYYTYRWRPAEMRA